MQVAHGDAITIRFYGSDNKYHNIFIDAGFASTYQKTIKKEAKVILQKGEIIDIFVITHIDQDHIGGIASFLKEFGGKDLVKEYWFNGGSVNLNITSDNKISISQGIDLREYLVRTNKYSNKKITSDLDEINLYGAKITILSPNVIDLNNFLEKWNDHERKNSKSLISTAENDYSQEISELSQKTFVEDSRIENKVSISFLLEVGGKSLLLLADSHPSTIKNILLEKGYSKENKLKVDYVKVSHHGSKSNTSYELLELIECNYFFISANGKNKYFFPHKEVLARILTNPGRDLKEKVTFAFNYDNSLLKSIFNDEDYSRYNFECVYAEVSGNGFAIKT